jgi:hypothetical protein
LAWANFWASQLGCTFQRFKRNARSPKPF